MLLITQPQSTLTAVAFGILTVPSSSRRRSAIRMIGLVKELPRTPGGCAKRIGSAHTTVAQKDSLRKGQRNALKKTLGFNLCEDSFWACPIARQLPLNKVMNDTMHCYFANSVAAAEFNLFVAPLRSWVTSKTLRTLSRLEATHQCGENSWWVGCLFLGNMFKGSASQCQALISLFRDGRKVNHKKRKKKKQETKEEKRSHQQDYRMFFIF